MSKAFLYPGTVAYFTMDAAIDTAIPTYSGGLGILAGDMIRSAADLGISMVAVTLLFRRGYVRQELDSQGNQLESPEVWAPEKYLEPLSPRALIRVEGRDVCIRAWQYRFEGINGHVIPLLFLDTDLDENDPWDRTLTDNLYGGDERYRLCQELLLGCGGVAMLDALGYSSILLYHMNEGHSALVPIALLERQAQSEVPETTPEEAVQSARQKCVFTTHTPVPAGHDQFDAGLVHQVLGDERAAVLERMQLLNGSLNMTELAFHFSRFANGVSMRHREVSRDMFPTYRVNGITNGVHTVSWTTPSFGALYDRAIPEWRQDNYCLRYAIGIPLAEIIEAHSQAKENLFREIQKRTGVGLDEKVFTLGFARRATSYKRANLLLRDSERLKRISRDVGPMQLIYGGKAHPRDNEGKTIIRQIFEAAAALGDDVRVVYLPNYDMAMGKLLCGGVDVWLNTPLRPQEASGTSGMKAALNGVPSFSVLDGWWIEGHIENVTGWSIGDALDMENDSERDALSLYLKLEEVILPLFYNKPEEFAAVMRSTIAFNGSFFNTHRMMAEYLRNAYVPAWVNAV